VPPCCPCSAPLLPFQCPLAALPVPPCYPASGPLLPFQCPLPVAARCSSSAPLQCPLTASRCLPPPYIASHGALLACTLLVLLQQPGLPLTQPALGQHLHCKNLPNKPVQLLTHKHCAMTAGGELLHHLDLAGAFDEATAMFYAANVLLALEHLHCNTDLFTC